GVSGTLYGPLAVERLRYRDAGTTVLAETVRLDWSPLALLAATLRVDRLAANALTVTLADEGAAEPATPPANVRVPIRVELPDVRVDRAQIVSGGEPVTLAPVAASATLGVTRHTLALRELGTPWARVSGDASIGAWSPFRVEGRLTLRDLPTTALEAAEVVLGGTLASLDVAVTPRADWLTGSASARVTPFEPEPLAALTVALTEVNLAGLDPALPATRAAVDVKLERAGDALVGPLKLENALGGPINAGRLPLTTASGRAHVEGLRLRIEDIAVALGEGGRLHGHAEASPEGYSARLTTDGIRLDRLHTALRPIAPAGTVTVTSEAGGQRAQAQLREGDYALDLSALLKADRLEIDAARLALPGGAATASGHLVLEDDYAFRASGRLVDFDPGRLVDMPSARLNGTVEASGVLRPAWHAELAYRIANSTFAGAPATGEGRVRVTADRVEVPSARLAVGANRLHAQGRLGAAGDRLALDLDAPELGRLGLGAGGALRAKGWIGGTRANPAFSFEADGRQLTFADYAAQTLTVRAQAPDGLHGSASASAKARGLRLDELELADVEAVLEGTRQQHEMRVSVEDAALAGQVRARGGLTDPRGWQGTIEGFETSRPYNARLLAPVALRWRPGELETGGGALAIAGGEIRFDPLTARNGALSTSGRIQSVAVSRLLPQLADSRSVGTDLVVSGSWDLRAAEALNGELRLARDSGDVVLKGGTPLALGVSELALRAVARDSVVEATLDGQGDKLGQLSADLRVRAERSGAAWVIAPDAPIALRAQFAVPALGWVGPLLNPELRVAGSLEGRVTAAGTLRDPQLAGTITGDKLRVRYGAAGVRLTDGELRVELEQDRLIFRRIAFRGGEGTLTATGEARLANGRPDLELNFTAEQLAAVRQDDRELVVSGRGSVRSRDGALALEGTFTADRGLIELRPEGAPGLSGDVVIVSGEGPQQEEPTRLRLDVTLDLGDSFFVRGQGLDVRLTGSIRVRMQEGDRRPQAHGVVRVAEGRYSAYGQQLTIERGALLFDGPFDNPRLDILAIRKNQRVEAGVAITGTALSPRTALYSNPPVPDSQKLQWLILGSGPSGIGDADFGLTGASARPEEVVSLGAQLTSAVYVSVGQSLRNAGTFVQATLELTNRLALQGRTGAENAVTLLYIWSFD
ncbi:MAG TPA: translocation/assembly module TamB domain-containing protein, partial [Pelomicrobium sp.]|nr:translocation/assembly module TamB domain-containing protein [Pelomicrobium sp.]